MPNIHKSTDKLLQKIMSLNKQDAEKKMTEILSSFLQQNKYGIPILEAYENSIYNPSLKENLKKEQELFNQKKRVKSKKYALLLRYKSTISDLIKAGNGSRKISKYLNSYKLVNEMISHQTVNNFIKEHYLNER